QRRLVLLLAWLMLCPVMGPLPQMSQTRAMRSGPAEMSAKPKSGRRPEQPRRTALITGVTGQDGSYLAELLLEKGYEVVGVVRRSSTLNFERIAHIQDRVELAPGDLLDEASLIHILREFRPTEVYNLAAQSFVQTSF